MCEAHEELLKTHQKLLEKIEELERIHRQLEKEDQELRSENEKLRRKIEKLEAKFAVLEGKTRAEAFAEVYGKPEAEPSKGSPGREEGHEGIGRQLPTKINNSSPRVECRVVCPTSVPFCYGDSVTAQTVNRLNRVRID